MGNGLPQWRLSAAPSEPDLRSVLRGHPAVPSVVGRRTARCKAAPGGCDGLVSGRLCWGPHVRRTLPRTRPAIGFSDFRHDYGPAFVDPGVDRGHSDHRLGTARAPPHPVVSERIVDKLARRIRAEGPLTVAAFMATALHDAEGGYYATQEPIGAAGDFTTAPEISQIFGELIGLWCAELWGRIGRPNPVVVAELGPGRGVLITDLLRAAAGVPEFRGALSILLVEVSQVLRAEQQRRLRDAQATWVSSIEDLPEGPMLLIANEFLDALPIRQLIRTARGWAEHMVGVDREGRLAFVNGPASPAAGLLVPEPLRQSPPATIVEICPAALTLAAALGSRFARQPGAALFIDYGYFSPAPGPTMRALRHHRPICALSAP